MTHYELDKKKSLIKYVKIKLYINQQITKERWKFTYSFNLITKIKDQKYGKKKLQTLFYLLSFNLLSFLSSSSWLALRSSPFSFFYLLLLFFFSIGQPRANLLSLYSSKSPFLFLFFLLFLASPFLIFLIGC